MPDSRPSSSHEIGGSVDVSVTASLRSVSLAFEHQVRASEHREAIRDLTPHDISEMAAMGQFAFASPAFAKVTVNAARRLFAYRHELAAHRAVPDLPKPAL